MKKNNDKVKISIFTTKWGHFSIGKAIQEFLLKNPKYKVIFNNIPVEKFSEFMYMPGYRFFPKVFKLTFKVAEQEQVSRLITKYLDNKYEHTIKRLIKSQKPNVVINTYFAFNSILEKLANSYNFLYINVVADARTFSKLSASSEGYNLVFDNRAKEICESYGVNKNKIIVSGWFVRKSFFNGNKIKDLKNKLGLYPNHFTILVVGGSAGNYSILKILPALFNPKVKTQVIFISGESKMLLKTLKIISEAFFSENLTIKAVGFVNNLDEYMHASDLVVGKAGPNLLFEAVAAKKPFIAVSHIHGQEDGNLEIIKEYKLGIAEENQIKVIKLLKRILDNPERLEKFKKPIEKLANYNRKASNILNNFIEDQIKK